MTRSPNAAAGRGCPPPKGLAKRSVEYVAPNTAIARRILHLGNIVNNGYLNAKFLRRAGWIADSVSIDYRHVQGQPEWEDVAFVNPGLDHFDPDWGLVDLGGHQRVDWFHDVDLVDIGRLAEQIKRGQPSGRHDNLLPPADQPLEPRIRTRTRDALGVLGLLGAGRAIMGRARIWRERVADGPAQQLV